jgi:hypothetical protein
MALAAETKRITALFDYDDADINKGVQEFLRQMGKCIPVPAGRAMPLFPLLRPAYQRRVSIRMAQV